MAGRITPAAWAQPNGMAGEPAMRWAEEELLLPLELSDQVDWPEQVEPKPIMPSGTIDWHVNEQGARGRLPDESAGPLPTIDNAMALNYTTPGELAALDKRPRRITYFSLGETYWQDYDVDGRRLIPPYPVHPAGLMAPASVNPSIDGQTPGPVTSELVTGFVGGSEADFLSALAGA